MPRKVKLPEDFRPDDAGLWEKKSVETKVREYRLVTPLFGGGVEPRYADPITTVRTTEIKGQLRFWWRAVRGWQAEGSLDSLLDLEEKIWGGVFKSKSASKAILEVQLLNKGKDEEPFEHVPGKKFPKPKPHVAPSYLAFPLQPTRQDSTIYPVRTGVRFKLVLMFPKAYEEEVCAALWAWETFGGLGARTRRGFGAVMPKDFNPPSIKDVRSKLRELIKGSNWPEGVPHLHPDGLFYLYPGSWRNLADAYKNFRQWRGEERERNKPGRSKWPEPDEIRRLTNSHSSGHKPRHPVRKFPRGQFGLPIIFHFKDRGDPIDATLKGKELERLASPLGFKPYGEKGPVLVYVLEGSRRLPEPYILETSRRTFDVDVELTAEEAAEIEPLRAAGANPDPVEAFVEWLKKEGGKK
ncbi:type III-B CRISPR module RAMP protein Cmr1 [Oceanithermus sp.]